MLQAHIFYSGTVQGVGFRYAVRGLAQDLDLKGWVKNLDDGRVEMVAEGPQVKIEILCQAIEKQFGSYIRGQEKEVKDTRGEFKEFKIVV